MTSIETMENKASKNETTLAHVQALLVALDNDPKKWNYEGEVLDMGDKDAHCACGHSIRYGHPLHHVDNPERVVILGCVCVDHYESIDPEVAKRMKQDFENFKAKIVKQKKLAKKLEQEEKLAQIISQWALLKQRIIEERTKYYSLGRRIPSDLYYVTREKTYHKKEFISLPAAVKHYTKGIEMMKDILGKY